MYFYIYKPLHELILNVIKQSRCLKMFVFSQIMSNKSELNEHVHRYLDGIIKGLFVLLAFLLGFYQHGKEVGTGKHETNLIPKINKTKVKRQPHTDDCCLLIKH